METREAAIDYSKRKYTIEEYLEMENASLEKHEYYQGEIFAMPGAKSTHNLIAMNVSIALGIKLKGKPCWPYNSDTRVHIPNNTLFAYPDISVLCGEPESLNNDDVNILNPIVIFEVLSRSTKSYDRGAKFRLYKQIPALKEYIMIDSESLLIEAWYKDNAGMWVLKKYTDIHDKLNIEALSFGLPLTDIYERSKLLPAQKNS